MPSSNIPPNPPPGSTPGNTPGSTPTAGSSPAPAQGAPASPPSGAPVQGKSLKWLGMTFDPEQTKQLNNIMIQNIGQEIQKYNDKGVKAIKNYQKISEGQDPDE